MYAYIRSTKFRSSSTEAQSQLCEQTGNICQRLQCDLELMKVILRERTEYTHTYIYIYIYTHTHIYVYILREWNWR